MTRIYSTMTPEMERELVRAAVGGSDAAIERLHELCSEEESARRVCEHLFAMLNQNSKAVQSWLGAIAEMHPGLAGWIRDEMAGIGYTKLLQP